MLDGEITFLIGEEIKTARTGDFLMIPRNTRHAFRVISETARFLNGYTPASLEAALVEFATPATERVLPPKNASAIIKMTPELLSRYGMDIAEAEVQWECPLLLPGPDPLRPEAASVSTQTNSAIGTARFSFFCRSSAKLARSTSSTSTKPACLARRGACWICCLCGNCRRYPLQPELPSRRVSVFTPSLYGQNLSP
jgi:hypothetical protein